MNRKKACRTYLSQGHVETVLVLGADDADQQHSHYSPALAHVHVQNVS